MSIQNSSVLFLTRAFCGCCSFKCWPKHSKYNKLFAEGEKRIKSALNMVKIVKNLRQLKILMNNSLMSPEVKFMLQHAEKNFIDLDGSDSDYSSEALETSGESATPGDVKL